MSGSLEEDTKDKFQHALLEWQEEHQRKGMSIDAIKSKVMVVPQDKEETVERSLLGYNHEQPGQNR